MLTTYLKKEIFIPFPENNNYAISNLGRVKRITKSQEHSGRSYVGNKARLNII